MRRRAAVVPAVVVACAAASFLGPSAGASAGCTVAAANEVIQPYLPGPDPDAVEEVYCGEFLGPGSQAMVATVRGDCFDYGGWAVFDLVDDAWQLVEGGYHAGEFHAVTVDATGIREERPVHRRHDWYRCSPTGGSKARAWSWDGTHIKAEQWEQVKPALPTGNVYARDRGIGYEEFDAAKGRAIRCELRDRRRRDVYCQNRVGPVRSNVRMNRRGRLRVCLESGGKDCVKVVEDWEIPHRLPRGYHVALGPFRCNSRENNRAVRCVVRKTGKGFRLDNHGVHPVRRSG